VKGGNVWKLKTISSSEQLKEGQPFQSLKKTITINILDFNYIDIVQYHSIFHLWEDSYKGCKLTDILEIHFLELQKFRKTRPDLSKPLDRWLIFIEDSPEEVRRMAMNNDPSIAKAEELLESLGSLDEIKRYYEAREMAIHDEVTRITGARAEGRAEGKLEGKLETAKNLLSMGMNIQDIAAATGLSVEEIDARPHSSPPSLGAHFLPRREKRTVNLLAWLKIFILTAFLAKFPGQ